MQYIASLQFQAFDARRGQKTNYSRLLGVEGSHVRYERHFWKPIIVFFGGERERGREREREMSVIHRTVEGCLPVTAIKGERKDCTDILHSQYHLTIHFSQFHHPQDEGSTILRIVGTLNNCTVQKSKKQCHNSKKSRPENLKQLKRN